MILQLLYSKNTSFVPNFYLLIMLTFFSSTFRFHLDHPQSWLYHPYYQDSFPPIFNLVWKHFMISLPLLLFLFLYHFCKTIKLSSKWLFKALSDFFSLHIIFSHLHNSRGMVVKTFSSSSPLKNTFLMSNWSIGQSKLVAKDKSTITILSLATSANVSV